MGALDEPNGSRAATHDDRVGPSPTAEEANPAEQVAVGHARGSEHDIIAERQVANPEDPVDVLEAHPAGLLHLLIVAGTELPLDITPQALQRGRSQHTFGGAANPHEDVYAGLRKGGGNGRRHIPVLDQLDPGSDLADRADQLGVAWPVQDHHGVRRAVFSPNATFIAVADFGGATKLLDASTGKLKATLTPHSSVVNALAVTADSKLIASGSFDGTITLWDSAGKELRTMLAPN